MLGRVAPVQGCLNRPQHPAASRCVFVCLLLQRQRQRPSMINHSHSIPPACHSLPLSPKFPILRPFVGMHATGTGEKSTSYSMRGKFSFATF